MEISKKLMSVWYVVHTKSRFENVVYNSLVKKNVEVFSPLITVKSKRLDRKLFYKAPLFPGYIFVRTNSKPAAQLNVLKTSGVVRFIGNSKGAIAVPDNNIESLKIMVSAEKKIETGTYFKLKDRIIVVNGIFKGVEGFFSSYSGEDRVIVNIETLGQYAAVNINRCDVELIPKSLIK